MRGFERCCFQTRIRGKEAGQPPRLTAAIPGSLVSLLCFAGFSNPEGSGQRQQSLSHGWGLVL